MKTALVGFRPLFPVLLLFLFPLVAGDTLRGEETGEARRRLRTAEKEIEKLRGDLHEAHRELAAKNERIDGLEKELDALRLRAPGREARKPTSRDSKPGMKVAASRPGPDLKATPSKREKAPQSFVVPYEARSAVNYEGREKALAWVKSRLKENPEAKLVLTGWANDTGFPETNREVAENRARYLADFFVITGVSRDRLVVEIARGSREGEDGRQVEIAQGRP